MIKLGIAQYNMDNLWNLLKTLPPIERKRKVVENKALRQEINKLQVQQQKRTKWVEELQIEAKQISKVIGPKHLKIKQELTITMMLSAEHVTLGVINEVTKLKEEVQ